MRLCAGAGARVPARACACVCMHVCAGACLCLRARACVCVCMHVCASACLRARAGVRVLPKMMSGEWFEVPRGEVALDAPPKN